MNHTFRASDKMFDVICNEYQLLQMLSRFDIPLGFGDLSVNEVCQRNQVDTNTFLAVANFLKSGDEVAPYFMDKINVECLMRYLRRAHSYFLDFQIPNIRRTLVGAINCSLDNKVEFLILRFYDEYMNDVRQHMTFENDKVFTYVEGLFRGEMSEKFTIRNFERAHVGMDVKLQEMKNLIIKYYKSSDSPEKINQVLFDLFNGEKDLRDHCRLEDHLFVPAVELLEEQVAASSQKPLLFSDVPTENNELSERECEVVKCIAMGMSNKEVADALFISINTVLTHRKNIFRKLDIHSVSALTIYAVVNEIVNIADLKNIK